MAKKELFVMFKRRRKIPNTPYEQMTILDLVKVWIISKLPKKKQSVSAGPIIPEPTLNEDNITYIAIVLDGVVEDVMRAQNRLAALVLSNPDFIEFDPNKDRPQIGRTKYEDGKFVEMGNKDHEE